MKGRAGQGAGWGQGDTHPPGDDDHEGEHEERDLGGRAHGDAEGERHLVLVAVKGGVSEVWAIGDACAND